MTRAARLLPPPSGSRRDRMQSGLRQQDLADSSGLSGLPTKEKMAGDLACAGLWDRFECDWDLSQAGWPPMLVLTRKRNESIVINDNIVITVLDIQGGKARLGIAAPEEVPVHRQEVFDAIHGKTAKPTASGPAVPVRSVDP